MEARITGHTGLLALIGSPVSHSGSPAMYNYSFEKLGLDYAYVALDIKEDQVKDAINAMKLFNMKGGNVTMPDKIEASKYMDELSPAAQIIGAINTIVNDNGKLIGHITDGEGFVNNLKDHGVDVKGKKIVSILSGGNMDVITMSSVVQQGLIMRDRIFTVSVLLPDKPGELHRVSGIIAQESGNVIKLEHNQFVSTNRSAAVELRITLEAFGTEHKEQILERLAKEGFSPKIVRTSV